MKTTFKALVAFSLILLVVGFSSCLNSDDTPMRLGSFVTLNSLYPGDPILITDEGYKLSPTNPNALMRRTEGGEASYPTRASIVFELADGAEHFDPETVNSVTIVQALEIPTKTMSPKHDVDEKFYISKLGNISAGNGYVTLLDFVFNTTEKELSENGVLKMFNMYIDRVDKDTLFINFVREVQEEEGFAMERAGFMSVQLPHRIELQSNYPDIELSGDSVNVKIVSKGRLDEWLKTNPAVIRAKIN